MADYQTVRGMRDFLPDEMEKRGYVLSLVETIFEKYGYQLMETPAVESMDLLASKGGGGEEIKKEVYAFKDQGGRELGLRFDLTVPTARVVAGKQDLPKPFKRSMVGRVWRYDRPGAGRYREFWQADLDVFGSGEVLAEAECVAAVCEVLDALGFKDYSVRVNNRKLLEGLAVSCGVPEDKVPEVFRSIDKMEKIGSGEVAKELESKGIYDSSAKKLLELIAVEKDALAKLAPAAKGNEQALEGMKELEGLVKALALMGFGNRAVVCPSLARGLDYYTGNVFECVVGDGGLSIAGGGRYDRLVEGYGGSPTPAVGWSIGIERVLQLMEERGMFPEAERKLVYVAPANDEMRGEAIKVTQGLRGAGIPAETDLMGRKLSKQFAYADSIGASKVVVVGPKDLEKKEVTVRDMKSGKEKKVKLAKLGAFLKTPQS